MKSYISRKFPLTTRNTVFTFSRRLGSVELIGRRVPTGGDWVGRPVALRGAQGRRYTTASRCNRQSSSGLREDAEQIWLVSCMQYDLGYVDDGTCRIEGAANPFAAKLSPMSPV